MTVMVVFFSLQEDKGISIFLKWINPKWNWNSNSFIMILQSSTLATTLRRRPRHFWTIKKEIIAMGKHIAIMKENVSETTHHHHHVVPPAQISLTLSRHFSLSFIASGRFSGLHPVSSHCCCMYVRAVRPAFARP